MDELNSEKEECRGENKPRHEQTERDVSSGTHHMISPLPPLFVLQATKAGREGLRMRLIVLYFVTYTLHPWWGKKLFHVI